MKNPEHDQRKPSFINTFSFARYFFTICSAPQGYDPFRSQTLFNRSPALGEAQQKPENPPKKYQKCRKFRHPIMRNFNRPNKKLALFCNFTFFANRTTRASKTALVGNHASSYRNHVEQT